jgi:8-oxo-dGTP pyrophosphatase MutT (NUDIX family)
MDSERRLVEDARRFAESGATPVVPRLAATVLLLRPPFDVYLIRRAATMAFAADMYAFPGGSVDPRDGDVDWIAPRQRSWRSLCSHGPLASGTTPSLVTSPVNPDAAGQDTGLGLPEGHADAVAAAGQDTGLGLPEGQAKAVACAAVREVFEETGVLLAGSGDGDLLADVSTVDWEAARRAVEAREVGFAELLRGRGLVLRADLLVPWSRWVTPEFEPRRYDTFFFLARLPVGQRTRRVGGEASHALWLAPDQSADLPMLPPTRVTLAQVAGCGSIDAAMAADRDVTTPVTPRVIDGRLTY